MFCTLDDRRTVELSSVQMVFLETCVKCFFSPLKGKRWPGKHPFTCEGNPFPGQSVLECVLSSCLGGPLGRRRERSAQWAPGWWGEGWPSRLSCAPLGPGTPLEPGSGVRLGDGTMSPSVVVCWKYADWHRHLKSLIQKWGLKLTIMTRKLILLIFDKHTGDFIYVNSI